MLNQRYHAERIPIGAVNLNLTDSGGGKQKQGGHSFFGNVWEIQYFHVSERGDKKVDRKRILIMHKNFCSAIF
jgi:hypothetical protein